MPNTCRSSVGHGCCGAPPRCSAWRPAHGVGLPPKASARLIMSIGTRHETATRSHRRGDPPGIGSALGPHAFFGMRWVSPRGVDTSPQGRGDDKAAREARSRLQGGRGAAGRGERSADRAGDPGLGINEGTFSLPQRSAAHLAHVRGACRQSFYGTQDPFTGSVHGFRETRTVLPSVPGFYAHIRPARKH